MPRPFKSFIIAMAGVGALLAAGCTSLAGAASHDSAMSSGMAGDHQCMMLAGRSAGEDPAKSQIKPMACKMDCDCPMMQKQGAANSPSPPSLGPPEEHQHSPDAPATVH